MIILGNLSLENLNIKGFFILRKIFISIFFILLSFIIYVGISTFYLNSNLVGNIGKNIGLFLKTTFGSLAIWVVIFFLIEYLIISHSIYKHKFSSRRLCIMIGLILFLLSLSLLQYNISWAMHGEFDNFFVNFIKKNIGSIGYWVITIGIFSISFLLLFTPKILKLASFVKNFLSDTKDSYKDDYYSHQNSFYDEEKVGFFARLGDEIYSYFCDFCNFLWSNSKNITNSVTKKITASEDKFFLNAKKDKDIIVHKTTQNSEINSDVLDLKYEIQKALDSNSFENNTLEENIKILHSIKEAEKLEKLQKLQNEQKKVIVNDSSFLDSSDFSDIKLDKELEQEIIKEELEDIKELDKSLDDKLDLSKVEKVKVIESNKKMMEKFQENGNFIIKNDKKFKLPPIDFLDLPKNNKNDYNDVETDAKILKLLEKLKHFNIRGDVSRTYSGPVITTFEYKLSPGIKVSKIESLQNDLAMALCAESIRILAPMPGKNAVGIEIPNDSMQTIYLREILASDAFKRAKNPLTIALGKDIVGAPFVTNLQELPHLLIAGTTGSGKSVGINSILVSLLYRNTPNNLKLVIIDPKCVEFSIFNDIPHLLTPIITEPKKAIIALSNLVNEMDRRYKLFMKFRGVKNIDKYNAEAHKNRVDTLPFIVVIIDELADLMMTAGKDVEIYIARIAQKARACGIHFIIATQRPSADIVTGSIKNNLPCRIAFRVGSAIDSRVVLDNKGAESLLGRGDMLFKPPQGSNLIRLHAPYVSEDEIERVVDFLISQGSAIYDESFLVDGNESDGSTLESGELDERYEEAKEIVINANRPTISFLQRKMGIGYNRAANIFEQLEANGVVSAPDQKGKREIL